MTLCFALLTLLAYSQTSATPALSKEKIIRLLRGDVSPNRVAELVRQRGIDFDVTAEVEKEFREAGADDALLRVFRGVAPRTAAGQVRENSRDKLRYVWIPPGNFMMGCSAGHSDCRDDETPTHAVNITRGFWVGQTEVTQAAYERVMNSNPSRFIGSDLPVERVSWDDAKAYCEAVGMRLPTEAEWEYAARAGSTEDRYGPINEIAWYSGNSRGRTHTVATKAPNAWGLYDTLGNVWEWVEDWYDSGYYGRRVYSDPSGPNTSGADTRVVRGGSWLSDPQVVRVSRRGEDVASYGFRCAGELR